MYHRALQDAANTFLTPAQSNPLLDARYAAFTAARFAPESPQTIKSFIALKRTTILKALTNAFVPFKVTTPGFSTNRNIIKLSGTAPVEVADILVDGTVIPVSWSTLTAWSAQLTVDPGVNILNVQTVDNKGQLLTNYAASITITNTATLDSPIGKVVFNEIMYHPASPDASYVELFNRSQTTSFDLAGWRINGLGLVFDKSAIIQPGGYLVIAGSRASFTAAYGTTNPVVAEFPGTLNARGETLTLIEPGADGDHIVDSMHYASTAPWPASADGPGPSLQLIDAAQDRRVTGNWGSATPLADAIPQLLVPMEGVWSYTSNNVAAASWNAPAYNDSAWTNGGGLFYFESASLPGPKTTALPRVMPTWYFRTHFNYQGPLTGAALKFNTILDDGAVFYLNGQRIYSLRVDVDPILYTSLASSGIGDAGLEGSFIASGQSLIQGDNVLAVEVKQSGAESSDIVFGMELSTVFNTVNMYSPGTANSIKATLNPLPPLWINELQTENVTGPVDSSGSHAPWVEIFNASTSTVSLANVGLTDTYTNLSRWSFPAGTTIAPLEHFMVWLDGTSKNIGREFHANFQLSKNAGSLALAYYDGGGRVLDYIDYDRIGIDRSYGSIPDGDPLNRRFMHFATPGGVNNPALPPLSVYINEWMADNIGTIADPADGDFEDWIELYNASTNTAYLGGYFLSDQTANKTMFEIPSDYSIPPGGYLLVWADGETGQNSPSNPDLHLNFKLSSSGDTIALFSADGTPVDIVQFGAQQPDIGEGRFPDGSENIVAMTIATPKAANRGSATNARPVLAPIPAHLAIREQPLQFTVTASDLDDPPQNLTFALRSDAAEGAGINPVSGLFLWTPANPIADGVYSFEVTVTDDGVPSLSATNQFAVRVISKPELEPPLLEDRQLKLSLSTVVGVRYQVEFTEDLLVPQWKPLDSSFIATETHATIVHDTTRASSVFYRLRIDAE